ncbi:Uncharacterized protein TPAR_02063 [Tolypocladium paradoxum]|uniref:Uncharacterized protein n=1 Tax=Tolypocladium paradoxum TaxID=94208 RepID=A0A2S4L5P1_9HYPO|nr:Uncharacterized protein TPAR_02063 [Tolypocladium paradoxum]
MPSERGSRCQGPASTGPESTGPESTGPESTEPFTRDLDQEDDPWDRAFRGISPEIETVMRGTMRGEPESLGPVDASLLREDHRLQLGIVRGVRYHDSIANSPQLLALLENPKIPKATRELWKRARNARLIMSNAVPDMPATESGVHPYCIWHPHLAAEETYRELARRYPTMRYQVGRACAVAGYSALYAELDLLPDVSIAEEARDSPRGGDIFKLIMGQPVLYSVMDDYTRSVHDDQPRAGAFLNGDTAVVSSLDNRLQPWCLNGALHIGWFDITEDLLIDTKLGDSRGTWWEQLDHVDLLYSPLPQHLPTTRKELLILMAAYEGNIDRYARLCRPPAARASLAELLCIVRGIHHSTSFAKWMAVLLDSQPDGPMAIRLRLDGGSVKRAIAARFIMANDLSRVSPGVPADDFPYMIWYPLRPSEVTLRDLLRLQPTEMKTAIAHACIVCDYQSLFDEIDIEPDYILADEARQSPNRHYLEHLQRRATEKSVILDRTHAYRPGPHSAYSDVTEPDKEPTFPSSLSDRIGPGPMFSGQPGGIFDGWQVTSRYIERFICASEEDRRRAKS